ncbi:phospholipid carrier-dependent glycosyltransferase [Tengunoibacter tsumagoiensis]|uniref:Uncharacterized protein n=1 Tax=Tengunoibacter tsumagoiensis TaxID=2014871 RepID=A0A401ZWT5_9CHLR|nr:phospholipid carrier-dependent glycosyltransferase [Tengunoibacter tsumagoiensis]GCE11335.1 hypothetical protein KTT_11940 [Tengunoibacter tsumagoiensis]
MTNDEEQEKLPHKQKTTLILSCILCLFAGAYLYSLILNITPIAALAQSLSLGGGPASRIQRKLLQSGKWMGTDWHLMPSTYLSQYHTAYFQLLLLMATAFLFYGLCALCIHFSPSSKRYAAGLIAAIWVLVICSALIAFYTPGMLSGDIYSYTIYGRLLGIHHANPYFVTPTAFPNDPAYVYVYWKNTTTIYGPVWTIISAALARLAGNTGPGFVHIFRLFAIAMYFLNTLLVMLIMRALGRSLRTIALSAFLYACNPLTVLEGCIGAHNDILMLTFVLLGVLFSIHTLKADTDARRFRAYALPIVAFSLAVLVKFTALALLAFFIIALFYKVLRAKISVTNRRYQWGHAILTLCCASLLAGATIIACYLPFWIGHSLAEIAYSFTSSPFANQVLNCLLYVLYGWNGEYPLSPTLHFLVEQKFWSTDMMIGMGVVGLLGVFILWRSQNIRAILLIVVALFAVFQLFTTWFFAWYPTILVGLIVLCLPVRASRIARALFVFVILFSLGVISLYYTPILTELHGQKAPFFNWLFFCGLAAFIAPVLISLLSLCFPVAKLHLQEEQS